MGHHGEGLPDGLSGGPVLAWPPAPRRFLCSAVGCGARPPTVPLAARCPDGRGCSLRTPRASHTEGCRGESPGPQSLSSLEEEQGGGERSGTQERGHRVGKRGGPRPGDKRCPRCLGLSGTTSKCPRLWQKGLPYPLSTRSCPRHQKVCSAGRPALQRPAAYAAAGRTRPGDTALTLAIPWASRSVCMGGEHRPAIHCRRWQGVQRAPGLLGVEAQPAVCTPPVLGGG